MLSTCQKASAAAVRLWSGDVTAVDPPKIPISPQRFMTVVGILNDPMKKTAATASLIKHFG